jgi:16S rRNA (cytosine967-C5)-methyltransferase
MSKNAGTSSRRKPKSSSADRAPTTARDLAALVLSRVWKDDAWASPTLDAELRRAGNLDPRDARLATELVYGVLRTGPALEQAIGRHASSDRWRSQVLVRAHLCIAAYTILFLDRVPAFAAVSEAVDAIKKGGDRRVAGFANAVLRKLAEEAPALEMGEAIARSIPKWLRKSLTDALGSRQAFEAFVAPGDPPQLCLALREGEDRDGWLAELDAARPEAIFTPGRLSPRAILVRGAGDQRQLPGAGEAWSVQEEGAQALALMVGARSGEAVLDACAGRGGKAFLLSEAVGPSGAVDAADVHPKKLKRLRKTPWGDRVRHTYAVDWAKGTGDCTGPYDRVLVDAPCSGTGTLRRRPEIAARLTPDDVARLAALQIVICRRAATLVRDGGRLVYAVCSVLRQEAEQVVEALTAEATAGAEGAARLEPAPFDGNFAQQIAGEGTSLRLLPDPHGTDGYFVASFIVRRA